MKLSCSHGMSYAVAGNVKSYRCADYAADHPIIVCIRLRFHFRFFIIRPHCSTRHVDAAYCYGRSTVVCLLVCLSRLWAVQKRLNRLRCRLGCALGWSQARTFEYQLHYITRNIMKLVLERPWAQVTTYLMGSTSVHNKRQFWGGRGGPL